MLQGGFKSGDDFGGYASARHVAWQVGRVEWQGGLGGDDQLYTFRW